MNSNKCGERIKQRLLELNMSQADLCRRTGINRATMSQYISGKYYPTQKRLEDIANALSTTPAYLMGWTESVDAYQPFKDANWDKFREMYAMSASSGDMDDTLQPLLDAWMQLSDEAQQQLIQYAEFLLSKEEK